ncbi:GAF and ANTAR domain-containing protein [Agrococcus sp. HG114]|uniref:GAF and ANTAR domain-containing protein n=1 Tax=Agrococcus sp. HG114 TaxID=2969757 RepID=UPI00215B48A8|nr:GAF and ANTAR domain-containing protein [Agrococcus sp. HG114]MCR8671766.1 GAF and ANTAR domain-containing protein [Agrococcus sp. HG114]
MSAAFVRFAEMLTSEYDVVELLHSVLLECVELLDVDAGGLLLTDSSGELELVASTSERVELVEIMQLNAGDGPCVEAYRTGSIISVADVGATGGSWRRFREAARVQGYASAYAIPMRLRSETIGSIGLFREQEGELSGADSAAAQALAHLATIGIMHERSTRESSLLTEQLQRALESRIVIEQAKGVVTEAAGVDVDEAFRLLRQHARSRGATLRSVAEQVVARTLQLPTASQSMGE